MENELFVDKVIDVRFDEVDSLNIVWHGHYISYFELAREEFGRQHGVGYAAMRANDVAVPIVSLQCDYKYPLSYGDRVMVRAIFMPTPAAKIIFSYVATQHKSKKIVATGRTEQVFIEPHSNELLFTPPEFYKKWLKKMKVAS